MESASNEGPVFLYWNPMGNFTTNTEAASIPTVPLANDESTAGVNFHRHWDTSQASQYYPAPDDIFNWYPYAETENLVEAYYPYRQTECSWSEVRPCSDSSSLNSGGAWSAETGSVPLNEFSVYQSDPATAQDQRTNAVPEENFLSGIVYCGDCASMNTGIVDPTTGPESSQDVHIDQTQSAPAAPSPASEELITSSAADEQANQPPGATYYDEQPQWPRFGPTIQRREMRDPSGGLVTPRIEAEVLVGVPTMRDGEHSARVVFRRNNIGADSIFVHFYAPTLGHTNDWLQLHTEDDSPGGRIEAFTMRLKAQFQREKRELPLGKVEEGRATKNKPRDQTIIPRFHVPRPDPTESPAYCIGSVIVTERLIPPLTFNRIQFLESSRFPRPENGRPQDFCFLKLQLIAHMSEDESEEVVAESFSPLLIVRGRCPKFHGQAIERRAKQAEKSNKHKKQIAKMHPEKPAKSKKTRPSPYQMPRPPREISPKPGPHLPQPVNPPKPPPRAQQPNLETNANNQSHSQGTPNSSSTGEASWKMERRGWLVELYRKL